MPVRVLRASTPYEYSVPYMPIWPPPHFCSVRKASAADGCTAGACLIDDTYDKRDVGDSGAGAVASSTPSVRYRWS